jgi:hypothetical protein
MNIRRLETHLDLYLRQDMCYFLITSCEYYTRKVVDTVDRHLDTQYENLEKCIEGGFKTGK